jgi:hypothetical protein
MKSVLASTNGRTDDRTNEQKSFVKPIVGVLTPQEGLLKEVLSRFAPRFGAADVVGDWRPFTHTNYYEPEMGTGLARSFISFERLLPASDAAQFKAWAIAVEDAFRSAGRRAVNIDPGFLDANKVVLISGKHGGHKIALAPGAFADLLLWYNKGWVALPWAFPDFRDGGFFPLFEQMRKVFKSQMRTALATELLDERLAKR